MYLSHVIDSLCDLFMSSSVYVSGSCYDAADARQRAGQMVAPSNSAHPGSAAMAHAQNPAPASQQGQYVLVLLS